MSWVPLGPRFVFEPRNAAFKRLSRRNENGDQAVITNIAIEPGIKPGKPETIYAIVRPSTGGVGLFRCTGAGTPDEDWTSIADPRKPNAPVDPNCVAIDPLNSSTIYVGTWQNPAVYVSPDRGQTWALGDTLGGAARKLLAVVENGNTSIYAATTTGLFCSTDWSQSLLQGDIWSFCASLPASGPAAYYAGVLRKGLYTSSDPAGTWTNLNGKNLGLPGYVGVSGAEISMPFTRTYVH